MAQLGDLVRAKALAATCGARLRSERGRGPREVCRRRGRDRARLARPGLACEGARRGAGDARSARRPGERRACAVSRGPAPAPDRAPRRGRAHARRARPRALPARVEGRPRAGRCGDRDATPADEGGARCARPGRARRARRRYPCADGGGRKRIPGPEHARGAPDRAWRGATRSCSRRSRRCWRRRRWSWTRAVMSCATHARWSRSQGVRCCSRSHARWAKRGPQTCRGTRSSRGHSGRSAPMNRIARGCGSKSGGFARMLRTLAGVSATKRGFALVPRRAREVVVLARPVEEEHAAVLAFLADGESWSSSALALALGASQRTVQRALDSLAAAGKVQSFGRGRARRWMTPPVPGFTTTLLLPAPLPSD